MVAQCPNYNLTLHVSPIVIPLYHVIQNNDDFNRGPEQQQTFERINQKIVHAVALGPARTGQDVKNMPYTAATENGPSCSL